MSIRGYRDLAVWRKAMDLAVDCHALAGRLPGHEQYGLASQLRRAAASVPANIAEGRSGRGTREFTRFLSIASGSLAEVETHVQLAARLGYTDASETKPLLESTAEIGRMLNGLTHALASQKRFARQKGFARPRDPGTAPET